MKRLLLLTLIFTLFPTTAYSEDELPMVWGSVVPVTDSTKPNYDDDRDYENFSGRLYVDDVDIDVALYRSNDQEVVDRKDSAAYFDLRSARGNMLIADHNTHAFGSLGNVKKGTRAHIVKEDGTIVYYECVDVFKGHNTGQGVTDWNGNSVVGKADLLMYTCFDGWQNIWVTLWNITLSPEEENVQQILDNFVVNMQNLINDMLLNMENPSVDTGEYEEIELTLQID